MRILLVDDDDAVLISFAATLKSLPGHELRLATSGEEALKHAAEMGGVDLLISDVVMDPMDGFALRDAITERHSNVRTIFVTGYDLSDYADQTQNHQLLQKPFEPADLIAAVQKELGGAATPAAAPAVATPVPAPAPAPVATPAPAPGPAPAPATATTPLPPEPAAAPSAPTVVPPSEKPATPEAAPQVAAVATPSAVPSAPAIPVARPSTPAAPQAVAAQPVPVARPASPPAPQAAQAPATPVARPAAQQPQQANTPRATGVPIHAAQPAQPTAAAPGQPRAVARPVAGQPATAANPASPQAPRTTAAAAPTPVARAVPAAAAPAPAAVPQARVAPAPASPAPSAVAKAKSTQPMTASAPSAVPVAKPAAAVPVARPSTVVPVAKVAPAAASAVPVAKVVPAPVAKAGAAPQAGPAAGAVAPLATARAGAVAPQAPTPPDTSNLPAKTIGAYDIHHRLGVGRWGAVYAAVQTAINRPVALKILDPERAKDEAQMQAFTANARAKAGVQHPSILAVYEAGEQDGFTFYTREYVPGRNLAEIESGGTKIDEPTALKILRVVGEGLAYLQAQNIPHSGLEARSIYLGTDGQPRLANLASQAGEAQLGFHHEVQTLGKVLLSVLPAAQKLSPGLRGLLSRMVQTTEANPASYQAWAPVLQAVKALEPQAVPVEASKISAADRAAVAALDAARKAQQRSIYLTIGSAVTLVALIGLMIWFFLFRGAERAHDEMIHIPGGDFLFQSGEPATAPEFWIDKYEVTIGQYAAFLKDLDEHPRGQYPDLYERIEHLNQPPLKRVEGGHRPPNWHIFYPRAKGKMEVAGTPTSLDSPVVEVDWWSAYAYAKWRGRELPTEQEWEKAARGTKGFAYPWGEEADPKRVNSGADYNGGNPSAKAEIDGFIRYGDVDKQEKDKSPFGVVGMAGNVSEWILDWAVGPDKRTKFPMIKGGSFRDVDVKLDRRIIDRRPDAVHDWLGFRTVSHTAPKK